MKLVSHVSKEELEKMGFEPGETSNYEKFHIRTLKNGSWSLIIQENKELAIVSYIFDEKEENLTTKLITNENIIKRYTKELNDKGYLAPDYFVPPKGQMYFDNNGRIKVLK